MEYAHLILLSELVPGSLNISIMLNTVKSPFLEITFSVVYREHCLPADQPNMIHDPGRRAVL